jgi:hypothetical protein
MEIADWLGALEEAAALGCRHVQFIGGEPTMYPGLPRLIERARELRYEDVCVYTNGTHMTAAVKQTFLDHRVILAFSLYGTSGAVHDAVTRRNGSFEKTSDALALGPRGRTASARRCHRHGEQRGRRRTGGAHAARGGNPRASGSASRARPRIRPASRALADEGAVREMRQRQGLRQRERRDIPVRIRALCAARPYPPARPARRVRRARAADVPGGALGDAFRGAAVLARARPRPLHAGKEAGPLHSGKDPGPCIPETGYEPGTFPIHVIATDYPHRDSLFPEAINRFIGRDDLSAAAKERILWQNVVRLYRRAAA